MGITLDLERADYELSRALELARSDEDLPREWLQRTAEVARAKSKTYTPVLGTALLAKATDDRVSALALKEGAGHNAYNARGVGHEVLVPRCVHEGISLRTTGREPLNNQPFFRYDRIHTGMSVASGREGELSHLVDTLEAADFLRGEDARRALAAFLRTRLQDPDSEPLPPVHETDRSVEELLTAAIAHASRNPEGGRRGQALIAAALDLISGDVETARVNDPSRDEPADITAGTGDGRWLHEVKQRPITEAEVRQLVDRVAERALTKLTMQVVGTELRDVDVDGLRTYADRQGVLLEVRDDTLGFLRGVLLACDEPAHDASLRLANRYTTRMIELECDASSISTWRRLVGG